MDKQFTHLHTHSHFSLLDGMSKIPELVRQAKEFDMKALALTDHGNMYGAIEFYKTCKKEGIKPIIGVEAYVAFRSRFDKDTNIDKKRHHLTLLAKNEIGYKNLMKLVSRSYLEGYYYKPRMDKDLLAQFSEGVVCLTGCPNGELIYYLRNGDKEKAHELMDFYVKAFGRENVFVEIMKHEEVEWYIPLLPDIIEISAKYNLPIVGTWDSHYLHKDDREVHDTLLAINTNNANFKLDGFYHFMDGNTAYKVFEDIPGAATNTNSVADIVDIELNVDKNWVFPAFEIPKGTTHDDELMRLALEGLPRRGLEKTDEIMERINYEHKIIADKGYSPYFLCVADLIRFANEEGILSNTRGSAAGSMISYLTGITNVNPIEYNLPFERFLNPERPSLPDVDMDFADNRRDEVIEYAKRKYGEDKVAQIGTFGTMLARGSCRDVARAMGYPYATGDQISKLIPPGSQGFPMSIERALKESQELKQLYKNDEDAKKIIDTAKRLEGSARHVSVHAAGVVIAPEPIDNYSPVQFDPKGGKIITQYDMYVFDEGLLPKFDFLGIRNLAILADAVRLTEKVHGVKIDVENIPIDDKKTYEMLTRGETMGVFQMSSDGMTRYIKELKPTTIHDINAMVALYRPGPMEFIPEYIERKQNPSKVTYIEPRLKQFLEPTFGILIYQDDILLIAVHLAGYSWGEADKFRKAVGKKIPEEMEKQHDKFIKGCIENGMADKTAKKLWDMIETFAAYGFNKAHAASYGQLAYRTAYMKANYPIEYMTAILTAESGDSDKVGDIIRECRKMGIEVLPPSINESFSAFTVVDSNTIRFGLDSIKNVGHEISEAIIEERKQNGKFKNVDDLLSRVTHSNLNRKNLESFVKAGALDELEDRAVLLENMDALLDYNKSKANTGSQISLFGDSEDMGIHLAPAKPLEKRIQLEWEKEMLGLFISGHPLDRIREKLEAKDINIEKSKKLGDGSKVILGGYIQDSKKVITRKNQEMAFLVLRDLKETIEVVAFPDSYAKLKEIIEPGNCVAISGSVNTKEGEKSIILESAKVI